MDETDLRKIRLRKKYAARQQDLASDSNGFDPELDELFIQAVEVAIEMQWPIPTRAEFETHYHEEIAERANRE